MIDQRLINNLKQNDVKSPDIMPSFPASFFSSRNHYQEQLNFEAIRQYTLADGMRLASQINMRHDANGCYRCDIVAGYYISALECVRDQELIQCNSELFELVWQMTNLVLAHREMHKRHYLRWFDLITSALWEFAKRLKEESFECDLHIPVNNVNKRDSVSSINSDHSSEREDEEENYRRAIRITIYNCRALVYEQLDEVAQAIVYYRKCASVRPTSFEHQQYLQQTALTAMQRLIGTATRPIGNLKHRSTSTSRYSYDSVSTVSSNSSLSTLRALCCSQCGIEKLAMPVCAKCKAEPYCSIACMKTHKPVHESSCSPRVSSRS